MEDIQKKSGDLDRVKVLSRDLQSVLNVSPENLIILFYHLQLKNINKVCTSSTYSFNV